MMQEKKEKPIEGIVFKEKIEKKIFLSGHKIPTISEEKIMIYIPSEHLIFCHDGFEGFPVVIFVDKKFFILAQNKLGIKKLSSEIVKTIVLYGKTFRTLSNPLIKNLFDLK